MFPPFCAISLIITAAASCISSGVRNLQPRTTGSVPRNEQCVCHWGSKPRASRRTTYELGCRAEGREISRETIMKRRAPVLGSTGSRLGNCEPVEARHRRTPRALESHVRKGAVEGNRPVGLMGWTQPSLFCAASKWASMAEAITTMSEGGSEDDYWNVGCRLGKERFSSGRGRIVGERPLSLLKITSEPEFVWLRTDLSARSEF